MKVRTKRQLFQDIALAHIHGEIAIDPMREIYIEQGFFPEEERDKALREWMNEQLRRFARQKFTDEDGNVHELVNIKRENPAPGQEQQVFGWVAEITEEDLQWVIEDRLKKVHYFTDEVKRFLSIYADRFGKRAARKFQRRLHFFPENEENGEVPR